jgi:acyl-[acyl-carrier-protein]-phospholipid O-acyltransferase/long-chain-fatty-acid--[acyl-carrier-protein] ligase
MSDATLPLLGSRRFLPLFITQFMGAANDSLYRYAIGILIVFKLLATDPGQAQTLATASAGIFILPYFLFSSIAGELADRMEKARLMRIIKIAEIGIMAVGAVLLHLNEPYSLLVVLFLLGVHSTFFGPLKYSVLPQYLSSEELIAGNALIEGGTFVAILIGSIVGGFLILAPGGVDWTSVLLLVLAACGLLASFYLPRATPNQPGLLLDWNLWRGSRDVVRTVTSHRAVNYAVIGISWFWAVGAIYLGQIPTFAKTLLGADEIVANTMIAMFSIGIGAGSILCERLLKGEISARLAPYGVLGMAIFTFDLYLTGGLAAGGGADTSMGIGAFAGSIAGLHVLADLFLIAVCGGLFTVPLYAIVQARSDTTQRARAVAANNIINSLYIVAASIAAVILVKLGTGVMGLFLVAGLGNVAIGFLAFRALRTGPA